MTRTLLAVTLLAGTAGVVAAAGGHGHPGERLLPEVTPD